jgi:DNA-binding response OmpR family regulator
MENTQKVQKKILVIEDDFDVASVLESVFDISGYKGYFFPLAEKALPEIQTLLPDLVITDLMMTGMGGFEVCKHIRKTPRISHIPVLAISGYDSPENRRKVFEAGADDYLAKPFEIKSMLKKIETLLSPR